MNVDRPKSKTEVDADLDRALQETFPGSDAVAVDTKDDEPVRPLNRRPAEIDKGLVEELSRKARRGRKTN